MARKKISNQRQRAEIVEFRARVRDIMNEVGKHQNSIARMRIIGIMLFATFEAWLKPDAIADENPAEALEKYKNIVTSLNHVRKYYSELVKLEKELIQHQASLKEALVDVKKTGDVFSKSESLMDTTLSELLDIRSKIISPLTNLKDAIEPNRAALIEALGEPVANEVFALYARLDDFINELAHEKVTFAEALNPDLVTEYGETDAQDTSEGTVILEEDSTPESLPCTEETKSES